jgi:hypothetical protein
MRLLSSRSSCLRQRLLPSLNDQIAATPGAPGVADKSAMKETEGEDASLRRSDALLTDFCDPSRLTTSPGRCGLGSVGCVQRTGHRLPAAMAKPLSGEEELRERSPC